MLDVHPPHQPTHTWRDFLIHIATIVVGLLIAVGLEQIVEHIHHRHLASEARRLLLAERIADERSNEYNIYMTTRHHRDLQRDLGILHAFRLHAPLPAVPFILRHFRYLYPELEWQKIHESGTINYIDESLRATGYRYENQNAFLQRVRSSNEELDRAAAVLRTEHDPLQTTFENNLADTRFSDRIADSFQSLSEQDIAHFFARYDETPNLAALSPAQIDSLEHAVQVALVDDEALLTYCFNIKRNLRNNPA